MSRVSEQSSLHAVNYSVGKTKTRLEDLQIKGSNLKRIQKPSDDPIGNIELLSIRSQDVDNQQFLRNSNYAKTLLELTETSIESLTDIVSKAKEIAIGQSSDLYNGDVRQSIAKEVHQLRLQAIAISNKRMGNRYIFSGYKTLTQPFDKDGNYNGDDGKIKLEVSKDFFVPINLNGSEVFYHANKVDFENFEIEHKGNLERLDQQNEPIPEQEKGYDNLPPYSPGRGLASVQEQQPEPQKMVSLFDDLQTLENALLTNNPDIVQNTLENLDDNLNRLIALRTKVGAISNSITNSENSIENQKLLNASYKSKIEDADIAELFGEISREQNVLKATYKSTAGLLNSSLLDFIR
jgi:flagellar hook-associated protein 3 FlgL